MFFLCVFKAGIIRHGTHGGECPQAPPEHKTAISSPKKKKKKKKQETEKMNKTTRKKKIKKGSFSIHFVRLGQTGSIKGPLSGLRIFLLSPILGFVFFPEKSNQILKKKKKITHTGPTTSGGVFPRVCHCSTKQHLPLARVASVAWRADPSASLASVPPETGPSAHDPRSHDPRGAAAAAACRRAAHGAARCTGDARRGARAVRGGRRAGCARAGAEGNGGGRGGRGAARGREGWVTTRHGLRLGFFLGGGVLHSSAWVVVGDF
jgi:hypothetical protein